MVNPLGRDPIDARKDRWASAEVNLSLSFTESEWEGVEERCRTGEEKGLLKSWSGVWYRVYWLAGCHSVPPLSQESGVWES
jgi:hypothetical protein